jgi:hypothetical protein
MDASRPIFWRWRVKLKPGAPECVWYSRSTWRTLRWRMTDEQAAEWGEKNGCEMEKIPLSGEQFSNLYGSSGYGGSVTPAPGKEL